MSVPDNDRLSSNLEPAEQEGAHNRFIDNAAAHISGVSHKSLRDKAYGVYTPERATSSLEADSEP